jgi:hypothetical protein
MAGGVQAARHFAQPTNQFVTPAKAGVSLPFSLGLSQEKGDSSFRWNDEGVLCCTVS